MNNPLFKDLIPYRKLHSVNKLIEQGQIKEASDALVELLEMFPNFAPGYNVMGWIYANPFGEPREAISIYLKAIELAPDYPPTYFNVLVALNTVGRYAEVPELVQKALELKGIDPAKIHYCLGMMYELQMDYQSGKEEYLQALRMTVVDSDFQQYQAAFQRCDQKALLPQ